MTYSAYADAAFTMGMIFFCLAVVSLVSSYAHGRSLRGAAIWTALGGIGLTYALHTNPGGYEFADAPRLMMRAIMGLIG